LCSFASVRRRRDKLLRLWQRELRDPAGSLQCGQAQTRALPRNQKVGARRGVHHPLSCLSLSCNSINLSSHLALGWLLVGLDMASEFMHCTMLQRYAQRTRLVCKPNRFCFPCVPPLSQSIAPLIPAAAGLQSQMTTKIAPRSRRRCAGSCER